MRQFHLFRGCVSHFYLQTSLFYHTERHEGNAPYSLIKSAVLFNHVDHAEHVENVSVHRSSPSTCFYMFYTAISRSHSGKALIKEVALFQLRFADFFNHILRQWLHPQPHSSRHQTRHNKHHGHCALAQWAEKYPPAISGNAGRKPHIPLWHHPTILSKKSGKDEEHI